MSYGEKGDLVFKHVSYSQNSLKGDYIRDYVWDYYGGY